MDLDIKRNGSRPSGKGSPDWFTGTVRVDPLFQPVEPARTAAAQVTFEPGARNQLAHASARADPDRDVGARVSAARRRPPSKK
jgi:quercetin dioxygenase-like cupin family protein